MERQEFSLTISATTETVWNTLWNDTTYSLWTAPFCEGSRAQTNWEKGSKVHFLDRDGNGLVSLISEKIRNEFMAFEHQGIIVSGVEDFESEIAKQWLGSLEYYRLRQIGEQTELLVEMDIVPPYKEYFLLTWPMALQRLKEMAEEKQVASQREKEPQFV